MNIVKCMKFDDYTTLLRMVKVAADLGITDVPHLEKELRKIREPVTKVVRIETQPLVFMEKK